MNLQAYVAERSRREPRFQIERDVAAVELTLGETLFRRRHERELSLAQLAEATAIPEERLEAIEEGGRSTRYCGSCTPWMSLSRSTPTSPLLPAWRWKPSRQRT